MVINKIVFTSPEAMVEFSGGKIKPRRSLKPFEHIQIYIRLRGQLYKTFSPYKSPIANHATRLCKECEKISYNPGTEPTLNHAISIVFRVMFFRKPCRHIFRRVFVSA